MSRSLRRSRRRTRRRRERPRGSIFRTPYIAIRRSLRASPEPVRAPPFAKTPDGSERGKLALTAFAAALALAWKAEEFRGIVHQYALAQRRVRRPFREQVEQDGIVGLGARLFGRMRPIAAPHHALGRALHKGLGDRRRVGIGRRADLRILIDARQFDPGAAGVEQPSHDRKSGMVRSTLNRDVAAMVE